MKSNLLLLCIFLVASAVSIHAQRDEVPPVRSELTYGIGIHTRGFNYASIQYGLINKTQQTLFFNIDFVELKSPKERRRNFETLSLTGGNTKSFIYGKRHNLYALRIGAGQKHYISEKKNPRGVALACTYSGGLSLGFLKPYQLDLIYRNTVDTTSFVRSEAYSDENHDKFLNFADINGASGFGKGWDNIRANPGIFLKTAFLFDWGAFDPLAKSLEIGISADIYFKNMPIMVGEVNSPIFINLYMNINLGKRW
ncbi:MAG: hypothetical protein MK212_16435 [Saprospiraceae bacterium]|nr:hypothetical protein [Saprospiraceae bacterium]